MSAAISAPPFQIRPANAGDAAYVLHSWRSSFAYSKRADLQAYDEDLYFFLMARFVQRLFKDKGTDIVVACNPADPGTVIGFAVLTGPELHYVYVRKGLRGYGVARALLAGRDVKTYSFETDQFLEHFKPASRGWTHVPREEQSPSGKFRLEMG